MGNEDFKVNIKNIKINMKKKNERFCPSTFPTFDLNEKALKKALRQFKFFPNPHSKLSAGHTSCFESTVEDGGKNEHLRQLIRYAYVDRTFDLVTLEETRCVRRKVRKADDLF
jgi:hypothetical protein